MTTANIIDYPHPIIQNKLLGYRRFANSTVARNAQNNFLGYLMALDKYSYIGVNCMNPPHSFVLKPVTVIPPLKIVQRSPSSIDLPPPWKNNQKYRFLFLIKYLTKN